MLRKDENLVGKTYFASKSSAMVRARLKSSGSHFWRTGYINHRVNMNEALAKHRQDLFEKVPKFPAENGKSEKLPTLSVSSFSPF